MLGHIHGRASVLAAQGQALHHTNQNQYDRREPPRGGKRRHQANRKGGASHNRERREEGVFSTDEIADPPKKQSAKWADHESDRKRGEVGDQRKGVVIGRIKFEREYGGQAAEDKKVIPFDHRPERSGYDYQGQ